MTKCNPNEKDRGREKIGKKRKENIYISRTRRGKM
jgi:hypothetical protein